MDCSTIYSRIFRKKEWIVFCANVAIEVYEVDDRD